MYFLTWSFGPPKLISNPCSIESLSDNLAIVLYAHQANVVQLFISQIRFSFNENISSQQS